ncbi:hypothetical protein [Saccharothrix sp. ALI-22-I]|uniref:hypothetical protein n=1 Tax=Saccharothrix sp. ALI-22-I TaxID=1933778 RepID=UPI00097C44BF|nr:hypothetical protein [Saccharothrix sp. ALI-22-I]
MVLLPCGSMKGLAVLGTVLLCVWAPVAMVYGLMAFTPTGSCEYSVSGVCAYGQLPMVLAAGGTALVWAVAVVLTWAGTRGRPRAVVPYAGIVLIFGLLFAAGRIAAG